MKKVLFFLESLSGGGAEKVLSDLICNLDKSKYDITVCTVTDEGVYQKKVESACRYTSFLKMKNFKAGGLKKILFCLKTKFIYKFPAKWVYKCFIREKYDVEVAFIEGFATKFIGLSETNSTKIAWIHTDVENNMYSENSYKNHQQHLEVYRKYSKIVCVSNTVKEAFERKFFISENVIVRYNPVDRNDIEKKKMENLNILRPGGILLGSIGRLEQVKGYSRLLECVLKLKEEGYQFSLWLIGEGTERKKLEEFVFRNNLEKNVTLIGFQDNPFKYMNVCDAFICSSYAEGFSTAATESLLLGKPIFTVKCAGMNELFGNCNCGEIVENNDAELYDMLKRVVSGQIDLNSFVNDIKKRASFFDVKKRIIDIERLLDEEHDNK